MGRLVDKVYSFVVDTENGVYNKKFDLDKNVRLVRGMLISSDLPIVLYYRGSQRIEISGDEIFPEDYESKLLMTGLSVPPDEKFKTLGDGVVAGNGEIKIQYKDLPNPTTPFVAYKVLITFRCEMK